LGAAGEGRGREAEGGAAGWGEVRLAGWAAGAACGTHVPGRGGCFAHLHAPEPIPTHPRPSNQPPQKGTYGKAGGQGRGTHDGNGGGAEGVEGVGVGA
jgi:hypothetical protein